MNFERKYEIIKNNDERYDLVLYYAVKSTKIFCRPSCKSKLPKKENVEFCDNITEAMEKGYRPCKRCRSDLEKYTPSKEICVKLKSKLDNYYVDNEKLKEEIKKIGLSQKRISQLFKEEYKITLNQYINILKLKKAKKLLKETTSSITEVAYESGFGSISVFYNTFKREVKTSPANYRKENKEKKSEICSL